MIGYGKEDVKYPTTCHPERSDNSNLSFSSEAKTLDWNCRAVELLHSGVAAQRSGAKAQATILCRGAAGSRNDLLNVCLAKETLCRWRVKNQRRSHFTVTQGTDPLYHVLRTRHRVQSPVSRLVLLLARSRCALDPQKFDFVRSLCDLSALRMTRFGIRSQYKNSINFIKIFSRTCCNICLVVIY